MGKTRKISSESLRINKIDEGIFVEGIGRQVGSLSLRAIQLEEALRDDDSGSVGLDYMADDQGTFNALELSGVTYNSNGVPISSHMRISNDRIFFSEHVPRNGGNKGDRGVEIVAKLGKGTIKGALVTYDKAGHPQSRKQMHNYGAILYSQGILNNLNMALDNLGYEGDNPSETPGQNTTVVEQNEALQDENGLSYV